jgi:ankyrin repeat protein
MDSLAKKHSRRDVRKALENLPKELDDTYDEAMQRIWSQDEEDAKLAEQVLSWISYAFTPLTVIKVQHALAAESGDEDFDEDALPDEDVLVSVCAGLVTIDQESKIIRLVHYTTQEYFERIRVTRFPGAQTRIATACLVYISFDVFAEGYCHDDEKMETRMHKYPFLQYAAKHWGDHARGDLETIKERAIKFLEQKSKVSCSNQAMLLPEYRYVGFTQNFRKHITGLHLVAGIGLAKIVQLLLEREGVDADSKDENGQTPLSWAAAKGHEAVVRLLLERESVDADSKNEYDRTPLWMAASGGHEAVVRLLLERESVDANSKNKYDETPLWMAASGGHEAVVRLLLERESVDADSKNKESRTPLWVAAANGHETVVRLLLERESVDADYKDKYGQTPLWWAAANGHEAVVRLLTPITSNSSALPLPTRPPS